jgi:hypothetical protein
VVLRSRPAYPMQNNDEIDEFLQSDIEDSREDVPHTEYATDTLERMDTDVSNLTNTEEPGEGRCWLCTFHGTKITEDASRFIIDSVSHMSLDSLVQELSSCLSQKHPDVQDQLTRGKVKRHIREHMLHPRVKMAIQVHDLSALQKNLIQCCVTEDPDTQSRAVNIQATRAYLSVANQIAALYKNTEDKMLFNAVTMDK